MTHTGLSVLTVVDDAHFLRIFCMQIYKYEPFIDLWENFCTPLKWLVWWTMFLNRLRAACLMKSVLTATFFLIAVTAGNFLSDCINSEARLLEICSQASMIVSSEAVRNLKLSTIPVCPLDYWLPPCTLLQSVNWKARLVSKLLIQFHHRSPLWSSTQTSCFPSAALTPLNAFIIPARRLWLAIRPNSAAKVRIPVCTWKLQNKSLPFQK